MMYKLIFVLVIFCVQIKNIYNTVLKDKLLSKPDGILKCGENEIIGCWNECEILCPSFFNLNAPKPNNCTSCMQGCICKPGYIRNSANGVCVGKDYCPIPDDICITHEMFSVCGAACQITCMSPNNMQKCPTCLPGYVCMPGYLRNPITGLCVTINECPSSLINCISTNQNSEGGGSNIMPKTVNMLRKIPKKVDMK